MRSPNVNRGAADHVVAIELRVHFGFIFKHYSVVTTLVEMKFEIQNFYHENYMFISGGNSESPTGRQIQYKNLCSKNNFE